VSQRPHRCRRGRGGATHRCCSITSTGKRFRSSPASRCGILLSGCIPERSAHRRWWRFSNTCLRAHSRKAAAGMGSVARSSQPGGARVRCRAEGPYRHRVPARLRSGIESHRIHLGPLQAPSFPTLAQRDFAELKCGLVTHSETCAAAQRSSPPSGTGFLMVGLTLYYAELSR